MVRIFAKLLIVVAVVMLPRLIGPLILGDGVPVVWLFPVVLCCAVWGFASVVIGLIWTMSEEWNPLPAIKDGWDFLMMR